MRHPRVRFQHPFAEEETWLAGVARGRQEEREAEGNGGAEAGASESDDDDEPERGYAADTPARRTYWLAETALRGIVGDLVEEVAAEASAAAEAGGAAQEEV